MKFLEWVKVVSICLVVLIGAGLYAYACEISPMEECQEHGHSFGYCWRILHQ